ncbi:hypothetical protein Tcan_01626, partial [Toxocara canis]
APGTVVVSHGVVRVAGGGSVGRCEQSEVNCEETCYGVCEAANRIWAGRLATASDGGCSNGGGRNCGRGSGDIGGGYNSNGRACGWEPRYVIWKRLQRWIAYWRSTGDDYRRWKRATRLGRRTVLL